MIEYYKNNLEITKHEKAIFVMLFRLLKNYGYLKYEQFKTHIIYILKSKD